MRTHHGVEVGAHSLRRGPLRPRPRAAGHHDRPLRQRRPRRPIRPTQPPHRRHLDPPLLLRPPAPGSSPPTRSPRAASRSGTTRGSARTPSSCPAAPASGSARSSRGAVVTATWTTSPSSAASPGSCACACPPPPRRGARLALVGAPPEALARDARAMRGPLAAKPPPAAHPLRRSRRVNRFPLASIVIPAHDEEAVLGHLLRALLADAAPGELEIVVVANGCHDRTAAVARSFGPAVKVVETDVASKANALNLGDRAATAFPRLYVDADVTLAGRGVRETVSVLGRPGVMAAAPRMTVDTRGASAAVRAFYAIWMRHPHFRRGQVGSGVYGLSERGRRRFQLFPEVTADDAFVHRSSPTPARRGATFTVRARGRSRPSSDQDPQPSRQPRAVAALPASSTGPASAGVRRSRPTSCSVPACGPRCRRTSPSPWPRRCGRTARAGARRPGSATRRAGGRRERHDVPRRRLVGPRRRAGTDRPSGPRDAARAARTRGPDPRPRRRARRGRRGRGLAERRARVRGHRHAARGALRAERAPRRRRRPAPAALLRGVLEHAGEPTSRAGRSSPAPSPGPRWPPCTGPSATRGWTSSRAP
jgi:hypothetical protein